MAGRFYHTSPDAARSRTASWADILRKRLQMFRSLRADTVAKLGQARHDEYDQLYVFFVELVEGGKLGGGRFSATA
jgi:hypothetical protein